MNKVSSFQVFRELLPGAAPDDNLRGGKFGDELPDIGIDNVFGRLSGRGGLSRRDRGLVRLGILIALRATAAAVSGASASNCGQPTPVTV